VWKERIVMHCLEVIIKRNDEAAGREAGHAKNDDAYGAPCCDAIVKRDESPAFIAAYLAARKEG
jgi:hypothetical protein